MIGSGEERDLAALVVPQAGALRATGRPFEPYQLVDPSGGVVSPAAVFLTDLQACGRPATTLRSYGMALLRWFRFVWAVGVPWDQATRAEARDFIRWLQVAGKPARPHWRHPGGPALSRPAARPAPNPVTGKAPHGPGYAPVTVAHCETVARGFYEFHLQAGTGPMVNPFPLARGRRGRPHAHRSPIEPFRAERSGLYRPKAARRRPRQIPDEKFSELFAALGSHRDRRWWRFGCRRGCARRSCSARPWETPTQASS